MLLIKLQLEKLKSMLTEIKEEAEKWLGLLDMGCKREDIESPIASPIVEEASAGDKMVLQLEDVGLRMDKGKQTMEAQNPKTSSSNITQHVKSVYSRKIHSTPVNQDTVTTQLAADSAPETVTTPEQKVLSPELTAHLKERRT